VWLPSLLANLVLMATVRHPGAATRSVPVVLAMVLAGVLRVHMPVPAAAAPPATVAVQQARHADPTGDALPRPAVPATISMVAPEQARPLTAQHIADARISRAPPAAGAWTAPAG